MKRLKTWFINIPNLPTMIAFRILRRAIAKDAGYAEGWHSNIAMAIYDESRRVPSVYDESVLRRTERGDFDAILKVPRVEAVEGLRRKTERQPLNAEFCNRHVCPLNTNHPLRLDKALNIFCRECFEFYKDIEELINGDAYESTVELSTL